MLRSLQIYAPLAMRASSVMTDCTLSNISGNESFFKTSSICNSNGDSKSADKLVTKLGIS